MDESMTPYGMRRLQAALLIGGLTLFSKEVARPEPCSADAPKLADYFGFQPLEMYKLERRIGNLMIRDLDGDKTGDIIVGNNARSRIDLLLSSKRPADEAETRPFRKEVNDLEFDRRMRLVSIPVNKEVVSIDTGDFNGDGKPDLVFYGTPAEVEILFNEGPGRFGGSKRVNTGEAMESPGALAVGDIDQDGRDDLVLACRERPGLRLPDGPRRAVRTRARAPHREQPPDGQAARPGRQRITRPGHPRWRNGSSDSRPVRVRREEAWARAALPGRSSTGDRLRPDRRPRRTWRS